MTSVFPKRKDLTLTPKITELGFTEIYSLGKMLILCTNTEVIHCRLDNNDLTKTTEKFLKKSLDKYTMFTVEDKEIICTHVCQIVLDSIKQQSSEEQQEKQQKRNEIETILGEINLLREHN